MISSVLFESFVDEFTKLARTRWVREYAAGNLTDKDLADKGILHPPSVKKLPHLDKMTPEKRIHAEKIHGRDLRAFKNVEGMTPGPKASKPAESWKDVRPSLLDKLDVRKSKKMSPEEAREFLNKRRGERSAKLLHDVSAKVQDGVPHQRGTLGKAVDAAKNKRTQDAIDGLEKKITEIRKGKTNKALAATALAGTVAGGALLAHHLKKKKKQEQESRE